DLQQADIVIVSDRAKHDAIADLLPDMPWVRDAAVFLVFCGNGRRVPRIAEMRGKPFPNDHLDAFFNPVVDAALVLMAFMQAADAVGLGTCPISVIRDHSAKVSALLDLPERVVPIAGLTLGWPADLGHQSARLPLAVTVHENRYTDDDLAAQVDGYDRRRAAIHGFRERDRGRWGKAEFYGWSEDKARQYATPQRADFGAFVRAQGFCLD
ncbi:MAG TPA: nitroreductase family protein, partial [Xanthobacteraceae bacterium]